MHLYLTHSIVGKETLVNFEFYPDRDYTLCRVCGAIFQAEITFSDEWHSPANLLMAYGERREWSHRHALTHSTTQHRQLAESGRLLTPEAAHRLAAYGIAPVGDMVFSEEHARACLESNPVPTDSVETTLKGGSIAVR
jgi:hypothetical protein